MTSRDTGVVVRELFSTAERSVLVAGFVVFGGKEVFKPLSDRMDEIPSLQIRLFLNVSCAYHDRRVDSEILREFGDDFHRHQWPGETLPEIYYDPRTLSTDPGPKASLHAKYGVVDDTNPS